MRPGKPNCDRFYWRQVGTDIAFITRTPEGKSTLKRPPKESTEAQLPFASYCKTIFSKTDEIQLAKDAGFIIARRIVRA